MTSLEFISPATDPPPPPDTAANPFAARPDPRPEQFGDVMDRALTRPNSDSSAKAGGSATRRPERPRRQTNDRTDAPVNPAAVSDRNSSDQAASAAQPPNAESSGADASGDKGKSSVAAVQATTTELASAGTSLSTLTGAHAAKTDSNANGSNAAARGVADLSPLAASASAKSARQAGDTSAEADPLQTGDRSLSSTDHVAARGIPLRVLGGELVSGKGAAVSVENSKALFAAENGSKESAGTAPASSTEAGGISVAQEHMPMQKAEKMRETAGLPEQNLPTGSAVVAKSSSSNGFDVPAVAGSAPHHESMAAGISTEAVSGTIASSSAERLLERTHDMMSLQALRLRDSGADALHVVIKPGSGLQLSLNLQMRGGGIEVQAMLDRGDFNFLSRHWNELQQQLESRGIRLAPLANGDPAAGSSTDGFAHTHRQPREEESRSVGPVAGLPTTGAVAATRTAANAKAPRGWESWA